MERLRRLLLTLLGITIVLVVLVVGGVYVFSNTDYGRERVRGKLLALLQNKIHGVVRMGEIRGNLLTGAVIKDLSITDSAGVPFLTADEAQARYRLRGFLDKRLAFYDVRLVRPLLMFDKPPGGEWNTSRLFPGDTTPRDPNTPHGFGAWFTLSNVTVIDGRVVVRSPWSPKDTLTAAQQDSVIARALGGETRLVVQRVPGGFQKVTEIKALNARFPFILINDPDTSGKVIEVARASAVVVAFQPPVAELRDLRGRFRFNGDSAWWRNVSARFPNSAVTGSGLYLPRTDGLSLRLRGAPAAFRDFRFAYPALPSEGGGTLDFGMDWTERGERYAMLNSNVDVGATHMEGNLDVTFVTAGDSVVFHDTKLRFRNLGTRLLAQLVPPLQLPRQGVMTGRIALERSTYAMDVDGDITFDDPRSGRSRAIATGELGARQKTLYARALRVVAMPLQVGLVRALSDSFPIGGTITGRATVTGGGTRWRVENADVVHLDRGERSRITGRGAVRLDGARFADVAVQALPLSLVTVGRFAPAAGLRGAGTGPIRVHGPLRALDVESTLRLSEGGAMSARGQLDLESADTGYDMALGAELFNANAVISRAPQTALTATLLAVGRGTDPATMRASVRATVAASTFDSVNVDSAVIAVTAAEGLATIEHLELRGPGTELVAQGTLGLAAGRAGELSYRVRVDSLGAFSRWLPRDTGAVAPRPSVMRQAVARAKADSAMIAQTTEVERAVTGAPPPSLAVDTPTVVRRDSIAGSLFAAGTVRGSLAGFDLRGRAGATGLAVAGTTVKRARTEYAWLGARTPASTFVVGAQMDSLRVAGFSLDSVDVRMTAHQSAGDVQLLVRQDDARDYGLKARFVIHKDHNELHFAELRLRFDTALWVASRPGAVHWGQRGIEIETLDLRSGPTGRIYVNGLLPTAGEANLEVALTDVEVSNFLSLLQSDIELTGRLSLAAKASGTARDPRVAGAAAMALPTYRGTALPDLRATFDYHSAQLTAKAVGTRDGGAPLLLANALVSVDLSSDNVGPRLKRDEPLVFDVELDSLPLEVLPTLTDAVANVRGRAVGSMKVRGTLRRPLAVGAVALDLGSFRVVPSGTEVRNMVGFVRLERDTIVIDSMVARAGGTLRVAGGIGIRNLFRPSFDLRLTAVNARILDTERGRARADAQLSAVGPYEAVYVSGGVRIREGVLFLPESDNKEVISSNDPALFNVLDTAIIADRELVPAQSTLLKNLRMDINLNVDRDTWVRSKEANVEIYSDGILSIHVDRARNALTLEGVVNTDRGEYTFLSKRFQLKRGSATFVGTPELNPTLQITGEYEVKLPAREALFIRLLIGGTLQSLRLTLESDAQPPISQSDLLSYLAFGRSSSSLLQLEGSSTAAPGGGGNLPGAAAALASSQLAGVALGVAVDELEGEAARSFGADVFNITPADVQTEVWRTDVGGFFKGTEVEFGKYLNPNTFVGLNLRPDPSALPGARYQVRTGKGFRVELSFQPRFLLQTPTLSSTQTPASTGVFGAFLVREWRF